MSKSVPAELLYHSLSKDRLELLRLIAEESAQNGLPLYMIGGSVRDLMLGSVIKDLDLTVEGDAISLARVLEKAHGGKVTAHKKFGTAKWFLPKNLIPEEDGFEALDLISARSETYKQPAALPTVKLASLSDDIHRRDFTINAMALRLDGSHFGELVDPLNGRTDLESGTIRVLHPKSFMDDPTRMYRAVRYEQRYGFKIAEDTLALIPEAKSLVEKLSAQRIRHELDLTLAEPDAALMLKRLSELDLLHPIHSVLTFDEAAYARLENLYTIRDIQALSPWNLDKRGAINKHDLGWLLWLMPFSREEIGALNKRLHFTADLLDSLLSVTSIYAELDSFGGLKPSQCVERLEYFSEAAIEALYFVSSDAKIKSVFFKYLSEWRYVKPHVKGADLKKQGLEPGPQYAQILRQLRDAWLDGEVKSDKEEIKLLQSLLQGDV